MTASGAGVLGTAELRRRLLSAGGLSVTPLPQLADIGLGSINLRLGRTFLLPRRGAVTSIDASETNKSARAFEELRLPSNAPLVLHPRQFVLAVTLEYLAIPDDLCGFIQSRSTYGRMGLIAATATYVNPGYLGCPTLEIVNEGDVPVQVRPGTPMCQLVVVTANETPESLRASRYHCAVRPYPPR